MVRLLFLAALILPGAGQEPPPTGPETEKRFPQLQVPPGFKATLFACDPLIEYPSVLAPGPRPGSVFLAHDYMTGLGLEIVRRSEIRLVEDTDGDGYADKSTVYAGEFNSIQGLAAEGGRVYAMHSPFLTALGDTNGDGIADERRDLFNGIGWPPEKAPDRLHGANGVAAGRDGWLYLALGDRGCDGVRPEGDRLVLNGGGILRCRPDGSDLHVFSTGLRNIYDVALDRDLNVFVRDNENDGGTYMIRVCRSFFGADHGYPYLYEDHPRESLAPLADLGRGSSAGSVFYLANAFPAEYHGNLFCCEWGRSIVRYRCQQSGAGFAPMEEIEFAAGAPDDPYGFRPTDLVVDRDGSLLVSDWADDQRPKRGRGRVYRIRYEGASGDAAGADRLAEVWALARTGGDAVATLFGLAETDPDLRVRIQAVRAIADLTDPVLLKHRLEGGRGDPAVTRRLAALARGQDPRILLEVVVALGRLRWADAPGWLRQNLGSPDPSLAHAVQQALRRAENWPAVLEWLDETDASPLRPIALRSLAEQAHVDVADGLLRRLETTPAPQRRRELAELLARIHRKPGPWVYWGFRPGPRPANTQLWERTEAIEKALDGVLRDPDRSVRLAVLRSLVREKIPPVPETLIRWLREDQDSERAGLLLASLETVTGPTLRDSAEAVVRDRNHAAPNRLAALKLLVRDLDAASEPRLLDLAGSLEESAVLTEALRHLAVRPGLDSRALMQAKLGSSSADVRAAAAAAVGKLAIREAADQLLALVQDPDAPVRGRSLEALAQLREPRALEPALRALEHDPESELSALECLAVIGGPEQTEAVASYSMQSRSLEALQAAVRALAAWSQAEAVARIQGASGVLLQWTYGGPFSPEQAERAAETLGQRPVVTGWRSAAAEGTDSRATFGPAEGAAVWLGAAEFIAAERLPAQFLASSNGTLTVWLNGHLVHRRAVSGGYAPDSDRFDGDLKPGLNRLVVQVSGKGPAQVHARFRRKSAVERHERLAQLALTSKGNAARGRELFLSTDRTGCGKCHRLGGSGGRVGPDLTGAGRRFSRIHLVESILEPSRAVAPAYRNVAVRLKNGRVQIGVKVVETEGTITLGDAQGQTHLLQKSQIDEQQVMDLSLMPDGIEKVLSDEELVDLITFLAEQR